MAAEPVGHLPGEPEGFACYHKVGIVTRSSQELISHVAADQIKLDVASPQEAANPLYD